MSNTDKTRQKLVNSMRKTKGTAASGSVPKTATTTTRSSSKAPAKTKKAATTKTRTRPTPDTGTSAKSVVTTASTRRVAVDSYQYGLRVWPD